MRFLGGYILAEGFFRIWFCPHSIIPSNLKSGAPPPGPLRLHPIIPKSFIFCFFFGGGEPRELKKHKLNKIKGKCKKKKLFCHDMSLHPTPTLPPTIHRRTTPGGQPSSSLPWRSLQFILTLNSDIFKMAGQYPGYNPYGGQQPPHQGTIIVILTLVVSYLTSLFKI